MFENDDKFLHEAFAFLTVDKTQLSQPSTFPFDTTFITVFDENESVNWYSHSFERFTRPTPTSIDLDIVNQFHKQEQLPTRFYDGAAHAAYLNPSRVWENWYCDQNKESNMCNFLSNLYNPSLHLAKTEVKRDSKKGRGVYAMNDISKDSFINPDDSHLNLHLNRYQWEELNQFIEEYPDAHMYTQLRDFYLSYGYENEPLSSGLTGWTVSVANMNTFMNHACGPETQIATNVDLDEHILFSPPGSRRKFIHTLTIAARNITKGEEIQMDYSGFRSVATEEYFELLQGFCDFGEGLVPVEYEEEMENQDKKEL